MTVDVFNALSRREKWELWNKQNGVWACPGCGVVLEDGPSRVRPFHGAYIECEACETELTRRTGGGQMDPFNWKLVKKRTK
jgi:hypothetical protein